MIFLILQTKLLSYCCILLAPTILNKSFKITRTKNPSHDYSTFRSVRNNQPQKKKEKKKENQEKPRKIQ